MSFLPEPDILLDPTPTPEIPLPKGWSALTLQTILHVIALARIIILNAANWPSDKECNGLRLRAENDRLRGEVEMLKMELAIKDSRFARLEPKKRPHYLPTERFEILPLRAMRSWSTEQTAKRFQVTVQTVINWMNGVDSGVETVQMPERTNRYPDYVRYIVQQLKSLCPMLGRYKIADVLARAGLHIAASTVKRIVDEPPQEPPKTEALPEPPTNPTVQAWYVNHVWSVDLTVVPSCDGLWTPWPPNALTQLRPYSWYVMIVIDHYSRRVMGVEVFEQQPTATQVISAMNRICDENNGTPKYLVFDQGVQFVACEFKAWCKSNDIKQRFGAIRKHGSIAVTERVILTYREGCTRRILVPISKKDMVDETQLFFDWYNVHRPHRSLGGKTPNEVYFGLHAANAKPRIETRPLAKHRTPCTKPRMCMAGRAGAKVRVRLEFLAGRLHLPILKVERS